jgi:hypothetical protein
MSREHDLAKTFVELASVDSGESDGSRQLNVLVRGCVETLGWTAAAALLPDQNDKLRLAAAAPEGCPALDLLGELEEQGRLANCYLAGRSDHVDLTSSSNRSPSLKAAGASADSVHIFPLRAAAQTIGSFALFGKPSGDAGVLALATGLAEAAVLSILRARRTSAVERTVRQLQTALDSRVVIEQAKGVLAAIEHPGELDMQRAFEALRTYARSNRAKISAAARDIIAGTVRPEIILTATKPHRHK